MTVLEASRRYYELMARHATPAERDAIRHELEVLREIRRAFPDAEWGPVERILLPHILCVKADRVARQRTRKAEQWRLRNVGGAVRSLDDETRSVRGQYAACLMLGIAFEEIPRNHTAARAHGNLGGNRSAAVPKQGSFGGMLVGEDHPRQRKMILVQDEGHGWYGIPGWCYAFEARQPQWERKFTRNGATRTVHIIPSSELRPTADLFT